MFVVASNRNYHILSKTEKNVGSSTGKLRMDEKAVQPDEWASGFIATVIP